MSVVKMTVDALSLVDKESLREWAKAQSTSSSLFDLNYLKKFITEFAKPGETWAAFMPIQNEPQIDWTEFKDLDLCFPKVTEQGLKFYKSTEFTQGPYGVSEPSSTDEVPAEKIKGLFIPGLVFDNRGQRLGRGKAYYDQYLKTYGGLKVGLSWSQFYIQGSMPTEQWDIAMDFVVTEKFIYQPLISKR